MSAAKRRTVKKKGSTSKKSASSGVLGRLLGRLIILLLIVGAGYWAGMVWWRSKDIVQPIPATTTHAFIVTNAKNPTILVVSPGTAASTLSSLSLVHVDSEMHTVTALALPANLADDDTQAGQYLASGYDRELQQLVENALAIPITGYLIAPRSTTDAPTVVDFTYLHQQATLWKLTVGLPWTLEQLPKLKSNLSAKQLWSLEWTIRGLDATRLKTATLPPGALLTTDGVVRLDPTQTDPIMQQLFSHKTIKDEDTSIVVKNATTTSGLAALVARFISNMGGTVVATEPADQAISRSEMRAEKDSALTNSLTAFLGIPLTKEPGTGRERSEVELILGADVLSRLGE